MTGPFDFFTTSRSGDMVTLGGGAWRPWPLLLRGHAQPVMTAAEPTTALRIMNVRRSTPAGSTGVGSPSGRGTCTSSLSSFIFSLQWRPAPQREHGSDQPIGPTMRLAPDQPEVTGA